MKSNLSIKKTKFLRVLSPHQDIFHQTQESSTVKGQQNEAFSNLVELSNNICFDDTLQQRKLITQNIKQNIYSPWRCYQRKSIAQNKKNYLEGPQKNQLLNNNMFIQRIKSKHSSTLLKYLSSENKQNKHTFFKTHLKTEQQHLEHKNVETHYQQEQLNQQKQYDLQKFTFSQQIQQHQVLHFERSKQQQEKNKSNSKQIFNKRIVSFPKCVSIECTPLKKRLTSQSHDRKRQKSEEMVLFWKKQAHTRVCSKKRNDLRAKKHIGQYGAFSEKIIKKTTSQTEQNFCQFNSSNPISRILLQKYLYVVNNDGIQ